MPEFYTEAELDIDPSEYWSECSNTEKKELAGYAIEDGYAKEKGPIEVEELFEGSTYTENELAKLLVDIWESRTWFSIKEIDELRQQLRENKKV
jgi:hypothetical protein